MKIGDVVPYFNNTGDEKPAVIVKIHEDGTVDLATLTANTRRTPTRIWKEPGTCQVVPEGTNEPAPTKLVAVPEEPAEVTELPVAGETTLTEVPVMSAADEESASAEEAPKRSHHKKHEE